MVSLSDISILEFLKQKSNQQSKNKSNNSDEKENRPQFEKGSILDILSKKTVKDEEYLKYEEMFQQTMNNATDAGYKLEFENFKYEPPKEPYEIIRSYDQEQGIDELIQSLEEKNQSVQYDEFDLSSLPEEVQNKYSELKFPSELKFHKDAESIFNLQHIPYDIETDKNQRLCIIGSANYEAKRIIISAYNDYDPQTRVHKIYNKDGWEIACIEVQNPLSNLILANIEVIIGATTFSMIMQGENLYHDIINYMIRDLPITIKTDLLREVLNHKEKLLVFLHNSKFDQNQVMYFNEKHDTFDFLRTKTRRFEVIKYGNTEIDHAEYKIPLGTVPAGFKVRISHDFFFNDFAGRAIFQIFPSQSKSATYAYGTDTMLMAQAVRRKSLSLSKLSEKLGNKKDENITDEEKIFTPE